MGGPRARCGGRARAERQPGVAQRGRLYGPDRDTV